MRPFFLLLLLLPYSLTESLSCPTIGTSAYVLVSISSDLEVSGFIGLLTFYSKLMPRNETITYHFFFGTGDTDTVTTKDIEGEVEQWVADTNYINAIYNASQTNSEDPVQYDDPNAPLSAVAKTISDQVNGENQQPVSVIRKKQVVLLTDYVPFNATVTLNSIPNVNLQRFGIFSALDTSSLQKIAAFPIFSIDDDKDVPSMRRQFQASLPFDFPSVHETTPLADNFVFLTSPDATALSEIADTTITGDMCTLSETRMYSHFMRVKMALNGTVQDVTLPWLGSQTSMFISNCISHLPMAEDIGCDSAVKEVISTFSSTIMSQKNSSFLTLVSHNDDCLSTFLNASPNGIPTTASIRIVSSQSLKTAYEPLAMPLLSSGLIDSSRDRQLVGNLPYYLSNYSTVCRAKIPLVPLTGAYPYHRPKYLHIALDDMVWITVCASISASAFGILIYQHAKRRQKKQMELLNEIMLQPRIVTSKECAHTTRLPWEIKAHRVHIDRQFMLGEGTVSNVFLGKLKGKAPIMQWIDRVEMKQYQDCAVAVRVPRHFDEPEEDQLSREIASMRRLRHNDHVALLLGWTNKDSLVCSLLELTHMNLIKYLGQIKETMESSSEGPMSTKYIPFQVLYKIIWEVCDGMAYIHSRNLVHRDLTARNVLLTTGLRAKISGFGFCSDPDDVKFAANSPALRFLPVRWMAPECFQGKFSLKSDAWSFAITLYEVFTLGEVPYEDLRRPEDIVEAVRKGRIPPMPKFASKETYNAMKSCLQQFPERRPHFGQLQDVFMTQAEAFYCNSAFEGD